MEKRGANHTRRDTGIGIGAQRIYIIKAVAHTVDTGEGWYLYSKTEEPATPHCHHPPSSRIGARGGDVSSCCRTQRQSRPPLSRRPSSHRFTRRTHTKGC